METGTGRALGPTFSSSFPSILSSIFSLPSPLHLLFSLPHSPPFLCSLLSGYQPHHSLPAQKYQSIWSTETMAEENSLDYMSQDQSQNPVPNLQRETRNSLTWTRCLSCSGNSGHGGPPRETRRWGYRMPGGEQCPGYV